MASLKEFITDAKSYICSITGEGLWSDAPAMNLEQVAESIMAITGEPDPLAAPDVTLADASSRLIDIEARLGALEGPD